MHFDAYCYDGIPAADTVFDMAISTACDDDEDLASEVLPHLMHAYYILAQRCRTQLSDYDNEAEVFRAYIHAYLKASLGRSPSAEDTAAAYLDHPLPEPLVATLTACGRVPKALVVKVARTHAAYEKQLQRYAREMSA